MHKPEDRLKQWIPLSGTPNLRDLGGRRNRHNQTMKSNSLFRSGFLTELSDADWQLLVDKNLQCICDFRRSDEVERMPTSAPSGIDVIHLPVGDGSHNQLIQQAFEQNTASSDQVAEFMLTVNHEFVFEHAEAFAAMFAKLLALPDSAALLFHCTAGKDRTGYAAALILFALGFDKQQVMEDYLLTSAYFDPDIELERIKAALPGDKFNGIDAELIRPILEVRPEFLGRAISTIENEMSIDAYLQEYMKLGSAELEQLRRRLLLDG